MQNFLFALSRGFGQVMFQNNVLSGLLMFAGLLINSWSVALLALLGNLIGAATAYLCKYDRDAINDGLYGFNGTLVGIAIGVFLQINVLSMVILVIASALSAVVTRMFSMQRLLPGYTAPFILMTWLVLVVCHAFFPSVLLSATNQVPVSDIDILSALSLNIGQVMFQDSIMTGIIFLIAILINSRINAVYVLMATLVSLLLGMLLGMEYADINYGLAGYNGVLCAIALCSGRKMDVLWAVSAVCISVGLQLWGMSLGVVTLTAPFVLAVWIVLLVQKGVSGLGKVERRGEQMQ